MPGDRKRMTARRLKLEDIINGKFYKQEGFEPNYVITPSGIRASRVSVVGTVVDTFVNDEETYAAVTLDDGSETVRAKFFQELEAMQDVEEGDVVEAIGKVKKYDGEMYVQPEVLKQRTVQHELLHALEAEQIRRKWQEAVEKVRQLQDADTPDEDIKEELKGMGLDEDDADAMLTYTSAEEQFDTASEVGREGQQTMADAAEEDEDAGDKRIVLNMIEKLDEGDGADYSAIIEEMDMSEDEVESVINDLLSDGTCYEPKPGRIKKL